MTDHELPLCERETDGSALRRVTSCRCYESYFDVVRIEGLGRPTEGLADVYTVI